MGGTGSGRGLAHLSLPESPLSWALRAHGFLDFCPTVSRKGVGFRAGDTSIRDTFSRSLPHCSTPSLLAHQMPGKSVPRKGCLAPEGLPDQPFLAAGARWGSHLVPETGPAVPSASRDKGDPKVLCPGECYTGPTGRQ